MNSEAVEASEWWTVIPPTDLIHIFMYFFEKNEGELKGERERKERKQTDLKIHFFRIQSVFFYRFVG